MLRVNNIGLVKGGDGRLFVFGMIGFGLVALLPLIFQMSSSPDYLMYVVVRMMILGLYAMSYDVLFGFTGIFSYGHAAFMGCGAYTVGIFMTRLGLNLHDAAPVIILSLLAGLVMGLIMGYVSSKVGAVAIFLVTFAFTETFQLLVFADPTHITGSEDGIAGIPRETILGLFNIKPEINYYYLVLILAAGSFLVLRWIITTPMGEVFTAIRENPQRVRFLGYRVRDYRVAAFMLAGMFGSLAGALTALHERSVAPEMFNWFLSGDAVLFTVLGGPGTLIGPVLGASIVVLFQEVLSDIFHNWLVFLGLSYIALVMFLPEGLLPLIKGFFQRRKADRQAGW